MSSDPSFNFPLERHYDKAHHLWAQWDEDTGLVRVGIDTIGLDSLGELAYVSLHAVGSTVVRSASIGTLEAAKMTTHIESPVSGTLTAHNEAVLRDPLMVNRDPYGSGWLLEIDATDWAKESVQLVSGEAIPGLGWSETQRRLSESEAAGESGSASERGNEG